MDIAKILTRKYHGAEWVLVGDSYSGLTWLSDTPKPTKAELQTLWADVQAEMIAEEQAKIDAKASAIEKLQALGLTIEEVQVAFGLEL